VSRSLPSQLSSQHHRVRLVGDLVGVPREDDGDSLRLEMSARPVSSYPLKRLPDLSGLNLEMSVLQAKAQTAKRPSLVPPDCPPALIETTRQ
jgi:hypothetical protein